MSAPVQTCPLEVLVCSIVRELAAAGDAHAAERVLRQATWALGLEASNALWLDLYGRGLFTDD